MPTQVRALAVALALGALRPVSGPEPVLTVSPTGEIIVLGGFENLAMLQFGVHAVDWGVGYTSQDRVRGASIRTDGASRIVSGSLEVPGSGGKRMEFRQEVTPVDDRECRIVYRFHFPQEVSICGYHLQLHFPVAPLVGKVIYSDGAEQRRVTPGPKPTNPVLIVARAGALVVAPDDPNGLTWSCDDEMDFWLQDNRAWGGDVLDARFRFMDNDSPAPVAAGTTVERGFTLRFNRPVRMALDSEATVPVDTDGWVTWPAPNDRSPIDLSALNDKPAGSRGFTRARSGRLAFADGVPARLWGMHLDGLACFPDHAEADRMASHLASMGANFVRMRRALPLLVGAEPGSLETDRMERLDYLVACLKREGVYVGLDVPITGRWEPDLAFLKSFWSHVNAHTRVRWRSEPAVALVQVLIERSLFSVADAGRAPQAAMDAERKRCESMVAMLREAGVAIPIAAGAWGESLAQTCALVGTEVIAGHNYMDQPHGRFADEVASPLARAPAGVVATHAATRIAGKPYVGMTADTAWSMEWRAEALISMSASAAYQGWDGCVSHVYRASAAPGRAAIAPKQYWNDPAVTALAPHAALLYRRGDVEPGRKLITVGADGKSVIERASQGPWEIAAFRGTADAHRLQISFDDPPPAGSVSLDDNPIPEGSAELMSDTGQLIRSPRAGVGTINTSRTQVVYGTIGGAAHELGDLRVDVTTPYAVIALSSLTDDPIRTGKHLLLTAVGRVENTGAAYNVLRTQRKRVGSEPILVEPIIANVSIRTASRLPVRPVRPDGSAGPELPTTYAGGRLTFAIGAASPTVHYRIGD